MSAQQILNHASAIASHTQDAANAALAVDDEREAKRILAEGIRNLRDLKRQLADEQRAIREAATDARQKIAGKGQMVGLVAGSKARGAMARGRAAAQRSVAKDKEAALRPYANAKASIDNAIAQMDRAKAGLGGSAAAAPAPAAPVASVPAAPPASPPPPPTPAAWAPDPFRRHELRYWDGVQWTHHVSNRGVQAIDPPS